MKLRYLLGLFLLCYASMAMAQYPNALDASDGSPTALYQITDPEPGFHKSTAAIAGIVEEVGIALNTTAVDRAPATLDFALPDGRRVTASKAQFEVERSYLSWSGHITGSDGALGYVHLIDRGERVTGIVNVGGDRFQIVPNELGHRLVRIELEDKVCFFEETERNHAWGGAQETWRPDPDAAPAVDLPGSESAWSSEPRTPLAKDAKSLTYIDVLAVYPNAFSGSEETGVRQFIENSISVANSVFANSNVNARYRLIDKIKLTGFDQPPATGVLDAIEWMTPTQVGSQNVDEIGPQEVLDLRDEYAADMVSLFVPLSYDNINACGIANLPLKNGDVRPYIPGTPSPGDFGKRAYTVHRDGCGLNDFTLAHELGHNFGMRHNDEDTDASVHLFATGRGHALSATPWRDIANGTLQTDVDGTFTVGYHFTPFVDGYVVGLGGLFNGEKAVRLWRDGSGSQLGVALVEGTNDWKYQELLVPIAVEAGTRYTVAAFFDGSGGSIYSNVVEFPRISGQVTIHGTTAIAGNARPTNTTTDVMYGQLDIRFVPAASLASTVLGCIRFSSGGDITDEVCNRIANFSDPNISVGGYATGTTRRNNAAVARAQSVSYANFRTNNAPVCQNDFLTTPMNTRLSVPLGALLGNDNDPDGDSLRLADYDNTTAQGGSNDQGHAGGFNYTPPSGFSGTDWFFYTVSDRLGHPAAQTDTCVVYVSVTGNEVVLGEVGNVTGLTHSGQIVLLSRSYSNPVVIAQTLTQNGGDTSVVRILDVQSDRFTFYVHEAPDRDGSHTTETVSYLVVEAGEWQLSGGTYLRAGKLAMSSTVGRLVANQWQAVSYGGPFSTAPVVLSQVQTNNDSSWVKTRHLSAGTTSFQFALEKDEASTVSHGTETVGWIAVEPGSGTWSGRAYAAGRTPDAVTDAWYTLSFGGSVGSPQFFAGMSTYGGADNAALRYTALSSTATQIRVEEDTTKNPETGHTTEVVGYLVVSGSGSLTGIQQ